VGIDLSVRYDFRGILLLRREAKRKAHIKRKPLH